MKYVSETRVVDEADLPPFAPPYVLSGSCLVAVGLWSGDTPVPSGFTAVCMLGRPVGIVIANHYTEPPQALPIRYREVIAASLARRGTTIVASPFDMVLDEQIPVDLGRLHYGMPKRRDATLRFETTPSTFAATANDLAVEARIHGPLANLLALPLRLAFALGVGAITAAIDVTGTAYPPARRARIALGPRGTGRSARVVRCTSNGRTLHALWCQSWEFTSTNLGAPSLIDPQGST